MTERTKTRSARIAQTVWLALAVAVTAFWAVAFASQWTALQAICQPVSACSGYQLDVEAARALSQRGVSLTGYAVYTVVIMAVVWIVWYGLAALIIWRKPEDRGALLSGLFLAIFPLFFASLWSSSDLANVASGVTLVALMLFGLLFPDGYFAPRWTRWLAGVIVCEWALGTLAPHVGPHHGPVTFLLSLFAVVGVQIYRFRSHSSWAQRQQTKWAFFGLLVAILGFVAVVLPVVGWNVPTGSLYSGFIGTLLPIVMSAIPLCIGIAVLRNRLWDIDRIINRALVYTTLSVALAAIYTGSVIGLQALFRAVTGQQSDLAIAISTLVIAALFNPLRHRIQDLIALSFYRRKYNAAHVLAAFGATCRDETDLGTLQAGLERVVEETLQPAQVSLWLHEGLPGLDKR
ncbi:MAG: hypothetical protein ACR2JC_09200 [Chloroflexota bacterium]